MKAILLVILLTWISTGYAQTAAEGRYVVIKGALIGCEGWKDRVLDVELVERGGRVNLLGIDDIPVKGRDQKEIEDILLAAIETQTGRRPETLVVEILLSRAEYEMLVPLYLVSLNHLLDDDCPSGFEKRRNQKRDLDEKNEMIRNMDISKRVA